jgi:chorismate dehydratase
MEKVVRIAGLDGLNAAPLQWGLTRGRAAARHDLRLMLRNPAASAAALAAGEADVALTPSIELQHLPGVRAIPGICVAARRRVRSVVLISKREPADLRSVAVDRGSRTSVALLQILLTRLFGTRPRLAAHDADPEAMLSRHDGALLIADAALRAPDDRWQVHDLAELWADWTGLPFVFAMWAVRPGLEIPWLAQTLLDSRAEGMAHLGELVREHAARDGYPEAPALTAYLSELLHYTLGPEEEASLARFFSEARLLGLTPEVIPLRYYTVGEDPHRAAAGAAP